MDTKAQSTKRWLVPALLGAVILLLVAIVIVLLRRGPALTDISDENVPKLGYSADAKVMLDQDSLQAAVSAAMENAQAGNIALLYKNNAYSDDGINFECYIANSAYNAYDMYLTIFADGEMTDQIFLSLLVPPGSGFDNITLEHALDPGDHTVYVGLTQVAVDEETGEQVIQGQVFHTMDFHVAQ